MGYDIWATSSLAIGGSDSVLADRRNIVGLPKPGQQVDQRGLLLRSRRRSADQRDVNRGIASGEARDERGWATAAANIDHALAIDDEVKRQIVPAKHLGVVGQQRA